MQVSVAVGSQLDFLATYAELAGVPVPNRTLDSHSLVPILFGGGYERQSQCAISITQPFLSYYAPMYVLLWART